MSHLLHRRRSTDVDPAYPGSPDKRPLNGCVCVCVCLYCCVLPFMVTKDYHNYTARDQRTHSEKTLRPASRGGGVFFTKCVTKIYD